MAAVPVSGIRTVVRRFQLQVSYLASLCWGTGRDYAELGEQVATNAAKSHRKEVAGERDGTKTGRSSGTAATAVVSLFPGLNVWDLKLCLS